MRTFAQKQKPTQKSKLASPARPSRAFLGQSRGVHSIILRLQRTIGNRAVKRLMQGDTEERNAVSTSTASPHFGYDFSRFPVSPLNAGAIQTKLAINKPGDEYEQEADRVAEQMMSMPEPMLNRPCVCSGAYPISKTEQSRKEEECLKTKRIRASDTEQMAVPTIVHEVLANPGQPLDQNTRAVMEPRFGYDFGQIRMHTDAKAAKSAQAIDAMAYTVGREVVFGARQYAPASYEGQRLLAHELTHVVQQSNGGDEGTIMRSTDGTEPKTSRMQAATHELAHQRPWDQLPKDLRSVYQISYNNKKLISLLKKSWLYKHGRNAEESFNMFALNQANYGHYISLLQMYKALTNVGLWKHVGYLVKPDFGVKGAHFSIVFIPADRNKLLGDIKGKKCFCRDKGLGRGGRKDPSFRQVVTDGTEGLHIEIGASTTEAHIDWISPVEGRESNGYCNYDIFRHGLRHTAWEKLGLPYIPYYWKFSDIPI